jgi:hypothetical protein
VFLDVAALRAGELSGRERVPGALATTATGQHPFSLTGRAVEVEPVLASESNRDVILRDITRSSTEE